MWMTRHQNAPPNKRLRISVRRTRVSSAAVVELKLGMRLLSSTLLLTVVLACSASSTTPNFVPNLATESVPGVSVSLAVAPDRVAPGDSIEFLAVAQNATAARVQIGVQCGPSFDVILSGPQGYRASVLALMVGPNGVFTCELSDRHFAPANGSQQSRMRIAAPRLRGQYTAVAGLRRLEGLGNLSASTFFQVR